MASDGVQEPLLPELADLTSQTKNACAPNKRRFRRVKSAPFAENVTSHLIDTGAFSGPEPISGGLTLSLTKVAMILGIYLGVGSVSFYVVRDDIKGKKSNPILDSLYFCITTMTTVGYGDLVPDTVSSKLLACLFVFVGMGLIGLIISKAADHLVEKQEILLVKALHIHDKLGPSGILKEIETHKVKYKCYVAIAILSVLMLSGTIFLNSYEGLDFIDSIYCVCSTITTLGYGDKSFSTGPGRFFAIFWIITSTVGLAQLFLYIAELLTDQRQKALVNWVLTRKMTHVDLEAADIDDDGIVGPAEFALYKLKEMGKISQEDIHLVMEEFDDLDVDQSGTLSVSDLTLAQATPPPQKKASTPVTFRWLRRFNARPKRIVLCRAKILGKLVLLLVLVMAMAALTAVGQ